MRDPKRELRLPSPAAKDRKSKEGGIKFNQLSLRVFLDNPSTVSRSYYFFHYPVRSGGTLGPKSDPSSNSIPLASCQVSQGGGKFRGQGTGSLTQSFHCHRGSRENQSH
jgi:hypothetical protein